MGRKLLEYDDGALVEMIAEGRLTYAAIGEKLGISGELVRKIAQGRRRRDLSQRLWDAENGLAGEARRTASQYARRMVLEQVRLGLHGSGELARRAREFLIRFAAGPRPRRQDVPGQQMPRPRFIIDAERSVGVIPWEDEYRAERNREAEEEALLAQAEADIRVEQPQPAPAGETTAELVAG